MILSSWTLLVWGIATLNGFELSHNSQRDQAELDYNGPRRDANLDVFWAINRLTNSESDVLAPKGADESAEYVDMDENALEEPEEWENNSDVPSNNGSHNHEERDEQSDLEDPSENLERDYSFLPFKPKLDGNNPSIRNQMLQQEIEKAKEHIGRLIERLSKKSQTPTH